jgi:hypothetical protein
MSKLGQVVSDVLGMSGHLRLPVPTESKRSARKRAALTQDRLGSRTEESPWMVTGHLTHIQGWMLNKLLGRL